MLNKETKNNNATSRTSMYGGGRADHQHGATKNRRKMLYDTVFEFRGTALSDERVAKENSIIEGET